MVREMSLIFFQIYFKPEQKESLYDFAIPYFNPGLNEFFENQIIADLVPRCDAELISVCSWRLRQKRGEAFSPVLLENRELTRDRILTSDFDVAILTPRRLNSQPLHKAHNWHGKSWDDAYEEIKPFLRSIGVRIPGPDEDLTISVYENHIIARKEIYHTYVNNILKPCMDFCRGKEVFYVDADYVSKKRRNMHEVIEYRQKSGREDWPIMPFVLERLFSLWIADKNFKVVNI